MIPRVPRVDIRATLSLQIAMVCFVPQKGDAGASLLTLVSATLEAGPIGHSYVVSGTVAMTISEAICRTILLVVD
jgi:hypothetical protein